MRQYCQILVDQNRDAVYVIIAENGRPVGVLDGQTVGRPAWLTHLTALPVVHVSPRELRSWRQRARTREPRSGDVLVAYLSPSHP